MISELTADDALTLLTGLKMPKDEAEWALGHHTLWSTWRGRIGDYYGTVEALQVAGSDDVCYVVSIHATRKVT
jgi:hypothetical protein